MTQDHTPISPAAAVAVMRIIGDEIKGVTADVRADAQDAFKAQRATGIKSLQAQLPGGAEVGRISIRDASPVIRWDGPALVAYVQETAPVELVDRVDPDVLADPELILWVLQHRPHMVRTEVRDAYRARLKKQLTDTGELVNSATGEIHQVAAVERPDATGAFSYTPSDDAREQVLNAWRSGALAGMGGVFAALTGTPDDQVDAEVDQ